MNENPPEAKPEKKNNMEHQFTKRVYYVSSPQDSTVLIAMDVQIKDGYVRWFDTVKERIMSVARVEETPSGISVATVLDEDGEKVFTFSPLTLEIYNDKVKSKLISAGNFEDEKSLFKALEETRNNAW